MFHSVATSTDEQQQTLPEHIKANDDEQTEPELLDLAIVGAGISGLMAARTVSDKRAGIQFRVFEKSAHPGGLLGGLKTRWITRHHYHAAALCRELNIPLTTVWRQSEVSDTRRTLQSIGPFREFEPSKPDGSVLASMREMLVRLESTRFMSELDCLCTVKFIPRNSENMDHFLCKKLLFEASRGFFRFLIKIGTGFYPSELTVSDCLRMLRSMSSASDLYGMLALRNGHLQPLGSPNWEVLIEQLVARVGHENVHYSTNIVQVEISSEQRHEIVSLTDSTGKRWRARYVILAVSCLDLLQISFRPTQPLYFQQPNSQLGLWSMANFTVRYPAPYWRDHGCTGCIFSPSQSLICHESGHNQLSGTYFAPLRGVVDDTERHLIRDTVLRLLRTNFNCRTMQKPLECSVEVHPIPFYFDVFPTFERCVIFASTNVSCWYRGFINGSIQGGIRAAILALLEIRPQTITFREVTDMQCIHFKYFQRRSAAVRFWYSLNLASACRFLLGTGAVLLTLGVCRMLFRAEFWTELSNGEVSV
ncbi:putative flavin-containing monoamine oxidase AofH [Anopheles maculipalpis]|uniref:putative flavin-containing monoamine oxidase AofH n=1 Tax=Anopheles maculipalpis TaxID=1496333 RepID=UPI0021596CBB|nr:putative flavin-containing monoamine oxidase AofH [Anopheles maculipalpis]